jgi:hypothetical protein
VFSVSIRNFLSERRGAKFPRTLGRLGYPV